jgi:hypothetical protein
MTDSPVISVPISRARKIKEHLSEIKKILLEAEDESEIRLQVLCLIKDISTWTMEESVRLLYEKIAIKEAKK